MSTWQRTIIGLLIVSSLTATVRADLDAGTYAPDFDAKSWLNTDEPITLTELRGMCVIVFFWVSWHDSGKYIMPLMTYVNSPALRTRGIYTIGLTDATKEKIEKQAKESKLFMPIGVESKSLEEYKIKGFPYAAVIDPQGKIVWMGWPSGGLSDNSELTKAILKVLDENPPFKTHPDEALLAERGMARARQALREGEFQDAYKAANEAIDHAVFGDPLRARCQDLLDLIESLGRDELARAQNAIDDKNWEDAVSLLRDLRRDFVGLEVSRTAFKRLEGLKKRYPEVTKLLEKDSDAAQGEMALSSAIDMLRARQFGEGYAKCEDIGKNFPETEAAKKAKTILDRMNANEGIMGYVRDFKASKDCLSLLAQAKNFAGRGQTNRARELYRKIIDEYGGTIYEDEAVRRIQTLP